MINGASKYFNFSPGPAMMFPEVIKNCREMLNLSLTMGSSIIEKSHRTNHFEDLINECKSLASELLGMEKFKKPFHMLLLPGGASMEFFRIALCFSLVTNKTIQYIDSGFWTKKAFLMAKNTGKMLQLSDSPYKMTLSSEDGQYKALPIDTTDLGTQIRQWEKEDISSIYICSNNTIVGTQYKDLPESKKIPFVADMTSDLFAVNRPTEFYDQLGIFFASTQKNLGSAGLSVVFIRDDIMKLMEDADKKVSIPDIHCYAVAKKNNSLTNTPNMFGIVSLLYTLRHMKNVGGVKYFNKINQEKSQLVYKTLDNHPVFTPYANEKDRSSINITFKIKQKYLEKNKNAEKIVLQKFNEEKLEGLKGHKLIGGFRASLYNPVSLSMVNRLVEVLEDIDEDFF